MDSLISRTWEDLICRIGGPLSFRLILQPLMASILGVRAGMEDAKLGLPAFGWAVLTAKGHRFEMLWAELKDVAKLFVVAVVIDLIYEIIVFRWIYPIQSLLVAAIVAVPPYLLLRGPVNRMIVCWRQWRERTASRVPSPHRH